MCFTCIYVLLCLPLSPFLLTVCDGGATPQFDDHLLAVVERPLVSQLLQGAGCVGQHAYSLAGSRQEGRGEVATRQHDSLCLLPLARPRLTLLCTTQQTVLQHCQPGISQKKKKTPNKNYDSNLKK